MRSHHYLNGGTLLHFQLNRNIQTTFFVTFGRIFDTRCDVYLPTRRSSRSRHCAIGSEKCHGLPASTQDGSWNMSTTHGNRPERILNRSGFALAPNYEKFKAIYQPIRHQVFAHKSIRDDKAIVALFEKTLITDVLDILRFLHTLFWAIWEMAWNAKRPALIDFRSYDEEVKRLTNNTEEFIRGLP